MVNVNVNIITIIAIDTDFNYANIMSLETH